MKAITIRQPWAELIASGIKQVENRTRSTRYRGLVAIHAANCVDTYAMRNDYILGHFSEGPNGLSRGAIVAMATLTDCHRATSRPGHGLTCGCKKWVEAGDSVWHLVLASVVRLPIPVPARGSLTVPWDVPEEEAHVISAQLNELR